MRNVLDNENQRDQAISLSDKTDLTTILEDCQIFLHLSLPPIAARHKVSPSWRPKKNSIKTNKTKSKTILQEAAKSNNSCTKRSGDGISK